MKRSFFLAPLLTTLVFALAVSGAYADEMETAREAARIMREQFVSQDIGENTANEILSRVKAGVYDELEKEELADKLTSDLMSISKDSHIRVLFNSERVARIRRRKGARDEESEEDRKRREQDEAEDARESRLDNYGLMAVEVLPGSVGYIRFDHFDRHVKESSETIGVAMSLLKSSDAILFDLRRNSGGSLDAIPQILGYFLGPDAVQYGTFQEPWKDIEEPLYSEPDVPGARHYDKPLYLLTSATTFSAAEAISYHLKAFDRATVVGERTYGGGNIWYAVVLNDAFVMQIPRTRVVNSVTGKLFKEGEGVFPQISSSTMQAFDVAYLAALNELITQAETGERQLALEWARRIVSGRLAPPKIKGRTLKRYAGDYGSIQIKAVDDALLMSFRGRPFVSLTPLSETFFFDDRTTAQQLEFIKDGHRIISMRVHRSNGQVEDYERK